jgi:uncharacterized membrane protein
MDNNDAPKDKAVLNENVVEGISSISIIFAIVNVVGLLGWTYVVLIVLSYSGISRMVQDVILYLIPYIYLSFSLYSCFGRNRELRTVKDILNLPLILLSIILVFVGYGSVKSYTLTPPSNKALQLTARQHASQVISFLRLEC